MDSQPRFRFFSVTFLVGFGIGSFVGVALALAAFALARPEDRVTTLFGPTVELPTAVVPPGSTPVPAVRTRSALEIYLGPGRAYAIIGSIGRGEVVEVLGRDSSEEWVAIRFPPNSAARGWLSAGDLDGLTTEIVSGLSVVAPTPLPRSAPIPTPRLASGGGPNDGGGGGGSNATPVPAVTVTPASTSTGPLPTATPGPNLGPTDLTVLRMSVLGDGRVAVVIGNLGPGDVIDRIVFVDVRNIGAGGETLSTSGVIEVGDTLTLTTSTFQLTAEEQVIATVDPGASIDDRNRGNNSISAVLTPPPTATPPAPTPLF
jgi:hypothetical protein